MSNVTVNVKPGLKPERAFNDGVPVKQSKKAVLIQNRVNAYKFVNEETAEQMFKDGEAVILRPSDPDYLEATKKALGLWLVDGKQTAGGDAIQINGHFVRPEDIGRIGIADIVKAAEDQVRAAAEGKEGILAAHELPALETFEGKKHDRRFVK